MSIYTAPDGTMLYINDGDSTGEIANYTPKFDPGQTLAKTVSGSTLSLFFNGWEAGGIPKMSWNGINYVNSATHGQAFQWAYNIIPTELYPMSGGNFSTLSGLRAAPVEQGYIADSQFTCASDHLMTLLRGDGFGLITIVNPAYWGDPTDTVAPTPLSTRRLSNWTTKAERIIGYNGNDHIIQSLSTITIPPGDYSGYPQALLCDATVYLVGATFTKCFSVNLNSGATTDVTPPSDGTLTYSQTEPRMWTDAAGTNALAVYSPPSTLGTRGFYGGRKSTDANTFFFRSIEPVVAGTYVAPPSYVCFGDSATVVAALQQLYGDHP